MPYTIQRNDEGEYCVYREGEDGKPIGDTLGCHPTQDEAAAQIGAIEHNEDSAADEAEDKATHVRVDKQFDFELLEHREDGGKIRITTPAADRVGDRVMPRGARTDAYLKNPIVQYGHNYDDPWATIGKTNALDVSDDGIVADFTLRPAANDADPQTIVRLLWAGKWLRSSSIGLLPHKAIPNDAGGNDYPDWELLEWSLVPVPMNPQALSMALKAFTPEVKEGRVVSSKDIAMFDEIVTALQSATRQIKGYIDSHRPESKTSETAETVTIAPDETQTVTPALEFSPLSEEALAVLKEFETYLKGVSL